MTRIISPIIDAEYFLNGITQSIVPQKTATKTAGIIGGLAPQSTGLFYQTITDYCLKEQLSDFPNLLINSVNPWEVTRILAHKDMKGLLSFLLKEIDRIQDQADFLVMVCNSIHAVIPALRERTDLPILAIYEEVCRQVAERLINKVGILGTKTTVDNCFYQKELATYGIASAVLSPEKEAAFDRHIFEEMLRGRGLGKMKEMILEAIGDLADQGCEGIILACTELPLFVSQEDVAIPLFSSTEILAEAVVKQCFTKSYNFCAA